MGPEIYILHRLICSRLCHRECLIAGVWSYYSAQQRTKLNQRQRNQYSFVLFTKTASSSVFCKVTIYYLTSQQIFASICNSGIRHNSYSAKLFNMYSKGDLSSCPKCCLRFNIRNGASHSETHKNPEKKKGGRGSRTTCSNSKFKVFFWQTIQIPSRSGHFP